MTKQIRKNEMEKSLTYSSLPSSLCFQITTVKSNVLASIHKRCELLLPIVMVRSAKIYRDVLFWMTQKPTSFFSNNLVLSFMKRGLETQASLNSGDMCRCQPTFNHAISHEWIRSSLRVMIEAIEEADEENTASFPKMLKRFTKVRHLGKLVAQHLIHCMSLVGLLPAEYATLAAVSETTKTAKRLRDHCISPSSFPVLLEKIQNKLGLSLLSCESAVCKEGKDSADSRLYCDVIYGDQDIIRYALWNEEKQRYVVRTIFRKDGKRAIESDLWRPKSLERETNNSIARKLEDAVDRWWAPCSSPVLRQLEEHFNPVTNKNMDPDKEKIPSIRKRNRSSISLHPHATNFGIDNAAEPRQEGKRRQKMLLMDHRQQYSKLLRTGDFRQAREEEEELLQYMKDCAKDGSYARYQDGATGSSELRFLHREGRLRSQPSRVAAKTLRESFARGGLKNVEVLLSFNVLEKPIILRDIVECAIRRNLQMSKSVLGQGVVTFTDEEIRGSVESKTVLGYTGAFTVSYRHGVGAADHSTAMHCFHSAVEYNSERMYSQLRNDMVHWGVVSSSSNNLLYDSKGSVVNRPTYRSISAAREAVLWDALVNRIDPVLWIRLTFHKKEWRPVSHAAGETTKAIVVTTSTSGESFATFVWDENGIWVRIEGKMLSFVTLTRENPYDTEITWYPMRKLTRSDRKRLSGKGKPKLVKEGEKKAEVKPSKASSENIETAFVHPQVVGRKTVEVISPQRNSEHVETAVVVPEVIHPKKRKSTKLDRCVTTTPSLFSPFCLSKKWSATVVKEKLLQWKNAWIDCLDDWLFVIQADKAGLGRTDRYWYPPGSDGPDMSLQIRSNAALGRMLDAMSKDPSLSYRDAYSGR